MKLRHIAAAVLVSAAASAQALPVLNTVNPTNMPVFGVTFGAGTSSINYGLSFTQASTLTGSLYSLFPSLPTTMTAISLTGGNNYSSLITLPASDSGTFSFTGITAGSYTLSFSYTTQGLGGFSGVINTTPAVPEPESVALALAGLGIVGLVARRRRAD